MKKATTNVFTISQYGGLPFFQQYNLEQVLLFEILFTEIVYIGVIHTEHVRLSMMMLEAGKHVVCEKPLAPTWQECKKVLDYAKEKKLLFLEVSLLS